MGIPISDVGLLLTATMAAMLARRAGVPDAVRLMAPARTWSRASAGRPRPGHCNYRAVAARIRRRMGSDSSDTTHIATKLAP